MKVLLDITTLTHRGKMKVFYDDLLAVNRI